MADGDLIIGGRLSQAKTWNDLLGSATAATGAASANFTTFIGSTKSPTVGVGDGIHVSFQGTHSWDYGAISPHLHFSVEPGTSAGNVKWQLKYVYCDSTELWSAEQTDTVEIAVTPHATAWKLYRRRFLDIAIASPVHSIEFEFYLSRIAASSAGYSGTVKLHWLDIHEPRTTLGTPTAVVLTP